MCCKCFGEVMGSPASAFFELWMAHCASGTFVYYSVDLASVGESEAVDEIFASGDAAAIERLDILKSVVPG